MAWWGYENEKNKNKPDRWRKSGQKTLTNNRCKKAKEIIEKAKNSPLSATDLIFLLRKQNNFAGVFPSDKLKSFRVLVPPVFIIINIDTSNESGSHWISVRIGRSTVEIFDSLGFNANLWGKYPKHLIKFLGRYSASHKFYISPILQPPNYFDCGLYCVFFVVYRNFLTFRTCVEKFSINLNQNPIILNSLLLKRFKYFCLIIPLHFSLYGF